MQDSADEDNLTNPTASEKLPQDGGSSGTASNEVSATRYVSVSDINCVCPPVSDADVDNKDVTVAGVYDSSLPKLAADSALVGSTDELTDGSGCMSLTEPSSSQVGSIVTVISQNHVAGDGFSSERSIDAASGQKDGMPNSYEEDKSTDAKVLESAVKPDSQPGIDGGPGMCSAMSALVYKDVTFISQLPNLCTGTSRICNFLCCACILSARCYRP